MAIDECPSRSATALMCIPDSNRATAAECRNVCTPTSVTAGSWGWSSRPQSRHAKIDATPKLVEGDGAEH
jgi:hypothetical protein